MKKSSVVLFVLFAMCFSLVFQTGCGKAQEVSELNTGNTLIYAAESEYEKINPVLGVTTLDDLIFRGLMRFDENNKPQLDIAASYTVSPDGLVYDFTLKNDIKFQDGEPLTAKDAAFTINTIIDPDTASSQSFEFTEVAKAEAVDDTHLKITLKEAFPPLLDKLTVGIIPEHLLAGKDVNAADFNTHPIGCGPYMFDSWEKGSSLTLKAYPDFHGTKPSIETVVFKFIPEGSARAMQLANGEVNLAFLEPSQVKNIQTTKGLKVYQVPSADYRCMSYNLKNDLWKDPNVRKAFNYSVDRKAIVDGILLGYGQAAYSPLQKNEFNNPDVNHYDYDEAKAAELLEAAGWTMGDDGFRYKDGKKLAFTLTTPVTDEVRVNIANYLASQYKKIGADVKVDALDWSVIKIADCDAFVLGWGSPYDADDHTYKLYHSSQIGGAGNNYNYYSNPKVDQLLTAGRIETEPVKRAEVYKEFQSVLNEDPSYNYLVYLDAMYGVSDKISGVKERVLGHHGAGFLWNLEEWKINE